MKNHRVKSLVRKVVSESVVFSFVLSKDMSSQAYETIFASVQLFPRILHVQYVLRRTSVDLVLHVTIDNV
jgi:hypothetical protein